jgi:hypothetical protein
MQWIFREGSMHASSAALFGGRERRGLYFDAQVRSGLMLLQANIFSTQRNKIQYHLLCAKEVGSLLWEVRELAMLSTAPGIDSVCFNASRLQHKRSWCSEMPAVRSGTQRSGLEHILSSI